jgi:ankyrin repeat protein
LFLLVLLFLHEKKKKSFSMGSRLVEAVQRGDLDSVRQELSSETVNYCHELHGTPLYTAVEEGHKDIVKLLLAHNDIKVNNGRRSSSPLYLATARRDKDIVELLLAHKDIEVNDVGQSGTPLYLATARGYKDIVELLLTHQYIQVNKEFSERGSSVSPLSLAATRGEKDIMKLLLAHKDIQVNNGGYGAALYEAIRTGKKDIVELLLAHQDIQVNKAVSKDTPLSLAIEDGYEDIAKLLISRKDINLDIANDDGWTPLSLAIARGRMEVIKLLLLKTSVGLNARNDRNDTPFSAAAKVGSEHVIRILILKEDVVLNFKDYSLKRWADDYIKKRIFNEIRMFLSENNLKWKHWDKYDQPIVASIMNVKDADTDLLYQLLAKQDIPSSDRSLLSWASENGYEALIRFLLVKIGTNPNTKDSGGRTPLSRAAENGRDAAVRLLLGNQIIPINEKDLKQTTEKENEFLLMQKGADPNFKDNDNQTPLCWALKNRHQAIVELLAPIDDTALFALIQERNQGTIELLARADYNLDRRNNEGRTPLHIAILSGHLDIAKTLLSHGANTDIQDNDYLTPLLLALQRKNDNLIQELLKFKADMTGIMIEDWRYAYSKSSADIVLLSETAARERQVEFLAILPTMNELSQVSIGKYKRL